MAPEPAAGETPRPQAFFSASGWQRGRGLFRGVAVVAMTVVILGVLFATVDISAAVSSLVQMPPHFWALAAVISCAFAFTTSTRWFVMLRTMERDVPWAECMRTILGICPVNAISPSKAGDLLRIWRLRGRVNTMETAGAILGERLVDLLVLATLAAIGAGYFGDLRILLIAVLVVAAVAFLFGIVIFLPAFPFPAVLQNRLAGASVAIRRLVRRPAALLGIAAITTTHWLLMITMVFILFSGVGASVPFGYALAAVPIAVFVGLVPVTLGGIGTRDAAMVFLFSGLVPASQTLAVSLLYTAFASWFLALLGLPFLRGVLR